MKYRERGRRALCVVWFLLLLAGPAVAWGQYEAPETDSGVVMANQHLRLDWDGLARPWLGMGYHDQRINWTMDSLNILHNVLQDEWTTSFDGQSKSVFLHRIVAGDTVGVPIAFDYDTYRLIRTDENTLARWHESVQTQLRLRDREKARDLVSISLPFKLPKAVQSIVGEGGAGLKVNGSKRISFSGRSQWRDGATVSLAQSQSKFPSLEMEQITQMTITGKIGSKIEVKVDQDSRRVSDLGNRIQIRYKGDEDEILQTVEAGNTNLSLPRTQFVGYSQRVQGLFGVKATAQVGHLDLTAIISQEKGSSEGATFSAGASSQEIIIRDYDYIRNQYFWLLNPYTDPRFGQYVLAGARIIEFNLFISTGDLDRTQGLCLPNIPDTLTIEKYRNSGITQVDNFQEKKRMKPIDSEDFFLDETGFYIILESRVVPSDAQVLAYEMIVELDSLTGETDTIGEIADSTLIANDSVSLLLQLLSPSAPGPNHPTWDLEWKNVYNLATGPIKQGTDLNIDIFRGSAASAAARADDLNRQDNTPYLELLGLDQFNESGDKEPDLKFDLTNPSVLDRSRGHIRFPNSFPFAPTSYPVANNSAPLNVFGDVPSYSRDSVRLDPEVPEIYEATAQRSRQEASKYYIVRGSSERSTEYNLGRINIIEGSEVVKLNGRQLQRGVDYNFSYELGQIRFLNDEVLDPNANVTVDYEYEPFLSTARKTLFGMRGEYNLGRNFKWGATALFKSEQQPDDQKPRLGEEPTRTMIWDTDLGFRTDVPLLTKLTDALPFVEAEAASNVDIQAEVAQSRPNPNTKGEVFVDDFEGSQEITPLPLLREYWTKSSPPVGGSLRNGAITSKEVNDRGKLIWYNRFDPYRATEIYDKEAQAAEDRQQVLTLKFVPDGADTNSWGGIMNAMSSAANNLSITQYLEIRAQGNKGKLVFDFGSISEDIDNDGNYDTEDIATANPNNVLEEGEDTGLDNLFTGAEPPCDSGDIYCDPTDPAGDDWYYNQSDKNNYWKINGTEGNRDDPARGYRPDKEDLNESGGLDEINNYFEFVINLADSLDPYLVQNSGFCDNCSNPELGDWRTFRIPINDTLLATRVGSPKLEDVQFMRMYVTNIAEFDTTQINIADMNFVSQRWRDTRIEADTAVGQEFRVAVVNTRENQDYTSPPGVTEIVDRVTQIGQGEQSLLLRFANLQPARDTVYYDTVYADDTCGDTVGCPIDSIIPDSVTLADKGIVNQRLITSQDYTGYRKLQMYVHGDNKSDGQLEFFLRFGTDSTAFYEYHSRIQPGWDPSNHIDVDFNELTGLKFEAQRNRTLSEARAVDTTGGPGNHYRIVGNPTLSRIEFIEMGVSNLDSQQVRSGEVWVDELRLTDVRKDAGWAARLSVNANFSDFISVGTSYRRQNYAFQTLTTSRNNVVNSNSTEDLSLNLRVSPHKILPPTWGIQLPVTINWGKNTSTPYLKTRSDIVVPEAARDEEATVTTREGVSIAERITSKSEHPLVKYLFVPFQLSLSYSKSETRSPTLYRSYSLGYTGSARYNVAFQKPFSIPLFFWTKYLLLPDKLSNLRLSLWPSNIQMQGNASDRTSQTQYIEGGPVTESLSRNFQGQMSLRYMPLPGLNTDYTYNTQRDLRTPGSFVFSLNPSKFKLGTETSLNQTLRTNYSTRIIPFLEQRYSFDATYQETLELQGNRTRTASLNRSGQANYGLAWVKLFGKPNDSDRWFTPVLYQPVRKLVRGIFNTLDPLNLSYTRGEQIRGIDYEARPVAAFRFGLTTDPHVNKQTGTTAGQVVISSNSEARSVTDSYSARSGVGLLGSRITFVYTHRTQNSRTGTQATESRTTTFPSVRFSYTDLTRFSLLKKLVNSASLESSYDLKEDEQYDLNKSGTIPTRRSTDTRFSPLVQLTLNFRSNISSQIKVDHQVRETIRESDAEKPQTRDTDNGIAVNFRYSFSAPGGIKLPFLRGLRLSSTMNLTVPISWTKSRGQTRSSGSDWVLKSERTSISVGPTAGYSFSQNLTGGLKMRWQDTHDKTQNAKSHIRELGFWVEFRF